MKSPKNISFSINDKVLGSNLNPSNLTLPLLEEFIKQVMAFLRGSSRPDLSIVKTSIKNGSLAVVADYEVGIDEAFSDYESFKKEQDLGLIDSTRARVIELWQNEAKNNSDRTYELFSDGGISNSTPIVISRETNYRVTNDTWVDVELYLYGNVYDLGGKNKANVHIDLENGKSIKVGTIASKLIEDKENRLYKDQLVRVSAKRNIKTGELKDEKLISFEHYSPVFREEEYERISRKAIVAWRSIENVSKWVEDLRGHSV